MVHGCSSILVAIFWALAAVWGVWSFLYYVFDQEWYVALLITLVMDGISWFAIGDD